MQRMTLITRRHCEACDKLKAKIKEKELDALIDIKLANKPEGMAFAAMHEILERPVPILVVEHTDENTEIIEDIKEIYKRIFRGDAIDL